MLPWEFLIYLLTWEPNRAEKISVPIVAAVNPTSQGFPYSKEPRVDGTRSRSESTGTPKLCSSSRENIDGLIKPEPCNAEGRMVKAHSSSKHFHFHIDFSSNKPRAKSLGNFTCAAGLLVLSREAR
jgi:hypothetical protein